MSDERGSIGISYSATDKATATEFNLESAKWRADYRAVHTASTTWQSILAGIVGIYGTIKQHQIAQDYLALAKDQVKQGERYLALAESNYNSIAVPTFNTQNALFQRYLTGFGGYEVTYLKDAFKLDEYLPEYKLHQGRAIGVVVAQFDNARLQRRRQVGKYNTGRACHDATQFAIAEATAKVAAINHAYRFEEAKKYEYDKWYWSRKSAGIQLVDNMRGGVISGLNGGAAGVSGAVNAAANAGQVSQAAFGYVENGYNNLIGFYGGIAKSAFGFAGYQQGGGQVGNGLGGFGAMGGGVPNLGGTSGSDLLSSKSVLSNPNAANKGG